MDNRSVRMRLARVEDARALLDIYAPYVEGTAVTFEYTVPTLEEFTGRIRRTLEKYPYLVAESDGEILGYAYAGPFHERAAYQWAVETSIYVKMGCRRLGIGRMLYTALENVLSAQSIFMLNACIAYPEEEDAYLTRDSVSFHQHLGYRMAAKFDQCAYKFHHWYSMVWMEKHLREPVMDPPAVKPLPQVRELIQQSYGID